MILLFDINDKKFIKRFISFDDWAYQNNKITQAILTGNYKYSQADILYLGEFDCEIECDRYITRMRGLAYSEIQENERKDT